MSAALVCAGAVLVGQLALRLCGAREWSWSAPGVGLAALMLVSLPAPQLPGRTVATALLLLVLLIAGIVLAIRQPAQRPPLTGMLAGVPVALLALVPFLSAWRAGTLGVLYDNDMASHLAWAEGFQSGLVERVNPAVSGYPLGPHALAGTIAQGIGARVDFTFAGLTAAAPVLLGWTAFGALRATGFARRAALAVVVGMPFLIAGYYGQGSFKELLQAQFALAVVVMLSRPMLTTLWRWVPLGLVLTGSVSVYSAQGLAWGVPLIGAWLVISLAVDVWDRGSAGHALAIARGNVVPVLVGLVVVLLLVAPQLSRLLAFVDTNVVGTGGSAHGTGIAVSDIGNLAGRIPVWPAFGIWDQPDYRFPAVDPFVAGMWTAFVLGLAIVGAGWCVRRRQWVIPLAAVLFMLIWAYVDRTQSPYVAAKALVIVSPLLLLLAALPVMDVDPPGMRSPRWWHVAAPILAVVLVVKVGQSSWHALRISNVAATGHAGELRELRTGLMGQRVLFLGNDEFVPWELAGVRVTMPAVATNVVLPTRPQKPWAFGRTIDFDSLPSELYNDYDWVITPRDAAGSAPPEGLRLVRRTRTYDLYRRVGTVPTRSVLAEGDAPGAVLRCKTRMGRALLRRGGVALVRRPSVSAALPPIRRGAAATVSLPLSPGTWDLEMPYVSTRALEVRAAGKRFLLPPSLDRPGPRLPVGAITVTRSRSVPVTITVTRNALTPFYAAAFPGGIFATKRGTQHIVPLRKACGRYVDWFRLRGPRRT